MNRVFLNLCPWADQDRGDGRTAGNSDGILPRSVVPAFKFPVSTGGLSNSTHGRIYDAASGHPYWFHYPSLSVDVNGNVLVGYSGSKTNEFIGAFYQGMKAGNWSRPYLLQAGRGSWTSDRWGDYSATSMDPNDGSFWTVQEFSSLAYDVEGTNRVPYSIWGTWSGQIKVAR